MTGYEVKAYQDLARISNALEHLALVALETAGKNPDGSRMTREEALNTLRKRVGSNG